MNKGPDNQCQAPLVEMMFGMVIQLAGRGAEAFQRCAQLRTNKDAENLAERKDPT